MMYRKTVAAAGVCALALMAGQAFAQDAQSSWQGPYVGGFAGYANTQGDKDERLLFDTNLDGAYGDTVRTTAAADAFSPGFCNGTPNGNNAGAGCSKDRNQNGEIGLRAGYDWQFGAIVAGVVGDVSLPGGEDAVTGFSTTPANYSFRRQIDTLVAARVRLGYTMGRYLPYVTGGYANGNVASSFASSNSANSFTPAKQDEWADGYQLGAGIETKVRSNISIGLEYMYTKLSDGGHIVRVGTGTAPATNPFLLVNTQGTDLRRSNDDIELHSVRLTAALRF